MIAAPLIPETPAELVALRGQLDAARSELDAAEAEHQAATAAHVEARDAYKAERSDKAFKAFCTARDRADRAALDAEAARERVADLATRERRAADAHDTAVMHLGRSVDTYYRAWRAGVAEDIARLAVVKAEFDALVARLHAPAALAPVHALHEAATAAASALYARALADYDARKAAHPDAQLWHPSAHAEQVYRVRHVPPPDELAQFIQRALAELPAVASDVAPPPTLTEEAAA